MEVILKQILSEIKGINTRLGRLEDGQEQLAGRMDKLEGRIDKLEDGQDKLAGKMDKLDGRMDKLEAGQEALQEGQNKHTLLLENIDKKLDITAEVIKSNFDNNQRQHEEINNNIARKVWTELARMAK